MNETGKTRAEQENTAARRLVRLLLAVSLMICLAVTLGGAARADRTESASEPVPTAQVQTAAPAEERTYSPAEIRVYQIAHGLTADGIATPELLAAMAAGK